jgi:hypothetical protein
VDTIVIELTDQSALPLLKDMEERKLIRVLKEPFKLSSLRGQIRTPMSNDEIDKQLKAIREEWVRYVN